MKTKSLTYKWGTHPRRRTGSALLVVLACLVFITVMIVAFFSSVMTERQASQSYSSSSSAKLLADSTVNIVMGQIKEATKGTNAVGATLAWASQPGMIRNYDAGGAAAGYHKLYSWSSMIGTGAFDLTSTAEKVPATWMNSPALYTDLNSPVLGVYPIVNPSAVGVVNGFSVAATAPVTTTNATPMPVQWLYMLQDGTLAPATDTGTGTTAGVALATAANPIVSRIAFWTDDDTSKVNINTAAGDVWTDPASPPAPGAAGNPGSFWDIPRTFATFEKTYLAKNQPAKNEFQRYPGHPATTYLSAVFPSLTPATISQIASRVNTGGSMSGTTVATTAIAPDNDRLYASVNELLFAKDRTTNPPVTPTNVEQGKFFLTAHSRAPEVSLFNQPRILTWPLSSDTTSTGRTAYDRLIANCGTLNNHIFYFQRSDSTSPINDLPTTASTSGLGRNRALISYLRSLTSLPIPGFSTNGTDTFRNKYPQDRDQILTEIFDYIRALNAQDTSGTAVSFTPSASGSGTLGKGQIIPITDSVHSDSNTAMLRGFGRFPTVREAALLFVGVGQTVGSNKSIPPQTSQAPAVAIADGKTRVQAVFLLNFFDPSQGYGACSPNYQVRVTQLNQTGKFQWPDATTGAMTSMGFPATGTVLMRANYNTGIYGGYKGVSSFVEPGSFSLISGYTDLPSTSSSAPTTFQFFGGPVKVEILNSAGTIVQTLTISFPDATFPVPSLALRLQEPGPPSINIDYRNLSTYSGSAASMPNPAPRFTGANTNTGYSVSAKTWICGKDVVRSLVANTDYRTIAAMVDVPSSMFSAASQYFDSTFKQAHGIAEASNGTGWYPPVGSFSGKFVKDADYGAPTMTNSSSDFGYSGVAADNLQPLASPVTMPGYYAPVAFGINAGQSVPVNGVFAGTNLTGAAVPNYPPGDWDTGFSLVPDGPYINKADEGTIIGLSDNSQTPYFTALSNYANAGSTFFSPNRQMPSAVMFGSLPTGVVASRPWQTLLFRPDPGGTPQHLGAQSPQDHLLLDLFNMPVVEPYAISDPFSTAGKVNMNSQIVPFDYIVRDTGIRAVLKSEQILALNNTDASAYKVQNNANPFANRRNYLNLDETMKGFQARFNSGDIFRSASEVCNIWLVPQGQSYAGMPAYWSTHLLTGDNVRERPYANIYPRLTTKSNTYTIHYRVQTLKKVQATPFNQWLEGKDVITGEYRGSSTLERYLDTSDASIPDYATAANPNPIDRYYKFRIVETRQFTP